MQETSALYKELFRSEHKVEVRMFINDVVYGMDKIVSILTRLKSLGNSGSPSVGNVCSAEIETVLKVPSLDIPRMALLRPQVRLTDGTRYSEWIEKGYFFVATREEDDDIWDETRTITIHGYDAMLKCQKNLITDEGEQGYWPKTDVETVELIAQRIGVTVDPRTYEIMNRTYTSSGPCRYQIPYPGFGSGAYTMNDILGYIGSAYMGNWVITDNNKLRLIQLEWMPHMETNYIVTEDGDPITFGDDYRILWRE